MNDDTLNAILRRVILEPDEDVHRLVYADRLDELGESDRAEFIRVQVEEQRIKGGGCAIVLGTECDGTKVWCVRCQLVVRFKTLWTLVGAEFERIGVTTGSRMVRGFTEELECSAETFLRHADALIWHETQTVEDGKCSCSMYGRDGWVLNFKGKWETCDRCKGTGKRRVPRSCPPTAQPIRRVVLTTLGGDEVAFLVDNDFTTTTGVTPTTGTSPKWPGVEFELPTVGTEAVSDEEEWNDHEVWGMRRVQ